MLKYGIAGGLIVMGLCLMFSASRSPVQGDGLTYPVVDTGQRLFYDDAQAIPPVADPKAT